MPWRDMGVFQLSHQVRRSYKTSSKPSDWACFKTFNNFLDFRIFGRFLGNIWVKFWSIMVILTAKSTRNWLIKAYDSSKFLSPRACFKKVCFQKMKSIGKSIFWPKWPYFGMVKNGCRMVNSALTWVFRRIVAQNFGRHEPVSMVPIFQK